MRHNHKVALLVTVPLFLAASCFGVFTVKSLSADPELTAAWRDQLGGATFPERYPTTRDNATVLRLEQLGAAIGLSMSPAEEVGRSAPEPDAAARYRAIKGSLITLDQTPNHLDRSPQSVPADVAAFLRAARPQLDAVSSLLLAGEAPVWRLDLEGEIQQPGPNLLGILELTRLLLADSRLLFEAGAHDQAQLRLDASWRLTNAVLERPQVLSQLIGHRLVRLHLLVLRSLPDLPASWPERLANLKLHEQLIMAFEAEAFQHHHLGTSSQSAAGDQLGVWSRWRGRSWARRFHHSIAAAKAIPVQDFDPVTFTTEHPEALPCWDVPAQLVMPTYWDAWPRGAQVELAAELTVLASAERQRLANAGAGGPLDPTPARFSGLRWRYEPQPGGTRIHLDGGFRQLGPHDLPLEIVVKR
ncbi:MAG: hypothetical protein SF066_04920 [Thermoanaerobaculia bacterium]|nr:hypothetical protein [Thermoanaerobaculia bacterium]